MAKSQKNVGGPFVATAVFCDNIIEEKPPDEKSAGVTSIVRIVDTIFVRIPPDAPADATPLVQIKAFISFKAGDAPSSMPLRLIMVNPKGKKTRINKEEIKVAFKGKDHHGHNLNLTLGLAMKHEGLYWLNVILGGRRMTSMPLRIIFRKDEQASSSQPPKSAKPLKSGR